jgi:cofilin
MWIMLDLSFSNTHSSSSFISSIVLLQNKIKIIKLQSSGVAVEDEIGEKFQDFKLQKSPIRYYVYKIENKKTIVIASSGERSATYEDFCKDLPENEPRYGLIDLEFETKDGRPTSKLIFISWVPDTASVREKMLYSSSKESIKAVLNGVGIHINATDSAELDLDDSILPVVKKFA